MARRRRKSKTEVETTDDGSSAGVDASSKPSGRKKKKRSKKRKKKSAGGAGQGRKKTSAEDVEQERSTIAASTEEQRPEDSGPNVDPDPGIDVGRPELDADDALDQLLAETATVEPDSTGQPQIVDMDPADEAEPVVENLDDDLDSDVDAAAARERLIAEALAFVESEDDIVPGPPETDDAGASDQGAPDLASDGPAAGPPEESSDDDDDTDTDADATPPEGPTRFKIGPDALAALTQLREQGLTTHVDDEVLDLGTSGTPEDRDRLLAATLAYSEMQEAIYRVPVSVRRGRSWKGGAASIVLLVAMIVAVSPPAFVVPDPPATLTEADRMYGLRVTLILQSQQIEAFRAREQRLPDSLADVAARLPGVRFVRSGSRLYQLVAYTASGEAIIYDSAAPAREFAGISQQWTATGDGS